MNCPNVTVFVFWYNGLFSIDYFWMGHSENWPNAYLYENEYVHQFHCLCDKVIVLKPIALKPNAFEIKVYVTL